MDEEVQYIPTDQPDIGEQIAQQVQEQNNFRQWTLNVTEILIEIEHRLRGEVWAFREDKKQYEWILRYEPMLKEEGILLVMNTLNNYFSRNTILTDLSGTKIDQILLRLKMNIADLLTVHYKEIGEPDVPCMTTVANLIGDNILFILNRALDGGERASLTKTEKRHFIESTTRTPQEPKGILQRNARWFKS